MRKFADSCHHIAHLIRKTYPDPRGVEVTAITRITLTGIQKLSPPLAAVRTLAIRSMLPAKLPADRTLARIGMHPTHSSAGNAHAVGLVPRCSPTVRASAIGLVSPPSLECHRYSSPARRNSLWLHSPLQSDRLLMLVTRRQTHSAPPRPASGNSASDRSARDRSQLF